MNPETEVVLNMDQIRVDPTWALRVPASLAVRRQVLAFSLVDEHVCVAMANPRDGSAVQPLQQHVQHPLKLYTAEPSSLRKALDRIYGHSADSNRGPGGSPRDGESDDAVGLCEELLSAALLRQASDVHLDPSRDQLLVRLRVDGVLEDYRPLPIALHASIVSRFKVMAGMEIAERRSPQDGRFTHS